MANLKRTIRKLFEGRIHRLPFLVGVIALQAMWWGVVLSANPLYEILRSDAMVSSLVFAAFVVSTVGVFALTVRRLHDLCQDGRYSLLLLLPPAAGLLIIYLAVTPAKSQ